MKFILKKLPLWIKEPIYLFVSNINKIPIQFVFYKSLCSFIDNINCTDNFKQQINKKKNKAVYNYLNKKYGNIIDELIENVSIGSKPSNKTIWVFWWQGENNAPTIVKKCINSIRKNSGSYNVIMIDKTNYREYIDIPKHILRKMSEKIISFTHFSDFYRMALLNEHGGIWIDASIYMKSSTREDYLEKSIFSIRNPGEDNLNISEWNWTVGVIGGWKGNSLFSISSFLLNKYWMDHNYCIDYFIFDYIIRLIYDKSDAIKNQINMIKPNNDNFYLLQNNANFQYEKDKYDREFNSDTWLYKLSWKGNYADFTSNGKKTYFNVWINNND